MNVRNEFMMKLVAEATEKLATELADPENPEYREVIKK